MLNELLLMVRVSFKILLELFRIFKVVPVLSKLLNIYRTFIEGTEDGQGPCLFELSKEIFKSTKIF